ncbi:MAG: hypothetical protein ISP01_08660 [Methanobrevibacter arboriphilus]|uniref:Uncharacterized protein n=1 Tax=Methanobrevibacter arboriphilus TaxID=39441 RepID=A0A843APN1_METAZ|nr:hypothetical protein [Methanobrevibacter arboriphilus]MBF4469458.1 hypothetical protein [Methanobrevibacter arboriphilus]
MIDGIIDILIRNLKGVNLNKSRNPEFKVWKSNIHYKRKNKFLGCFNDPYSASLVYWLVKEEIHSNKFEDRYIYRLNGRYYIRKIHYGKLQLLISFEKIENARAERDLLEKYDWNLEKVCECADETIEDKIIFNNRIVGVKSC